ncbi:hypothetical protein [Psittacicella gerlachiana]|uniref:Uncharacterized protein n=1 Tax=Psittacicella gerlachiana TaxID=2028574 RepID=A0A3A1YR51_9GAMM|nr:hypothetical protein [Psittacicella gerlachiana]RIY38894.1 hypothetical protein CKF59_00095 [Psittacicella gerlachiana]
MTREKDLAHEELTTINSTKNLVPKVQETSLIKTKVAKPELGDVTLAPKVAKTRVAKMVGRGRATKLGMIPESKSKAKRVTASIRKLRQEARELQLGIKDCALPKRRSLSKSNTPEQASNAGLRRQKRKQRILELVANFLPKD